MRTLTVSKVLLVNPEGKLLLIRRSESAPNRPLEWDVPGGHTDPGESAAEAAVRETHEETGIQVTTRELDVVYAMTERLHDDLSVTWVFHLAHITATGISLSHEHDQHKWLTLSEAIDILEYKRQKSVLEYLRDIGLLA